MSLQQIANCDVKRCNGQGEITNTYNDGGEVHTICKECNERIDENGIKFYQVGIKKQVFHGGFN